MKNYAENEIIEIMRRVKTGVITDAMKVLKMPSGGIDGIFPVNRGEMVVGKVFTMSMTKLDGTETVKYSNFQVVDQIPNEANTVALMAMQGDEEALSQRNRIFCGDHVVNAAINKGAAGLIVAGNIRDFDEIADCNLPVFSMGRSCKFSSIPMGWTAVGVPVVVDGVTINSGDYVVGDCDGVVFVPAGEIDTVMTQAERIYDVECRLGKAIADGLSLDEVTAISAEKSRL